MVKMFKTVKTVKRGEALWVLIEEETMAGCLVARESSAVGRWLAYFPASLAGRIGLLPRLPATSRLANVRCPFGTETQDRPVLFFSVAKRRPDCSQPQGGWMRTPKKHPVPQGKVENPNPWLMGCLEWSEFA
jgi:hypothetical protein